MKFLDNIRIENPERDAEVRRPLPEMMTFPLFPRRHRPLPPDSYGHHPLPSDPHGHHPLPPHKKRDFNIEFDEGDAEIFGRIFGDEDIAVAAMEVILDAPPDTKVIAYQILKMIRPFMPNARLSSFDLGENAEEAYAAIYADNGKTIVDIVEESPEDKDIISRMLVYLNMLMLGDDSGED